MNAYSILVRSLGKCPLGKPRRGCVDNIEMVLMEIGCEIGRWVEETQDRFQWRDMSCQRCYTFGFYQRV
jgi:hypothetical protein